MITRVQSPSFKAYVPVQFYAKNPANGKYVPVLKRENIKRCQGFVVRNLNGTAKNNKNEKFVDYYKQHDSDYQKIPSVHSVYDHENPIVYMVTGSDVDKVREMAKPIGKAKADSLDTFGHTKTFEVAQAGRDYYREVQHFIKNTCKCLKSDEGKNLMLRVYFDPVYGKRGKQKGKLQGFDFVNARFLVEQG
ncbi:MAG: hypothetical protein IJY61_07495 [Candidatus Gastranaerophilales bacterium]|nr:hypothetical protein [Candidatus Gastranaerophilales bacterium]